MPFDTSNGVSVLQDGLVRFRRPLPLNVLPPLLVIALITPPENRPYSAEMPEVSVCVSWMASSMNRFCGEPNRLSFTSTPLIMKTLSNANAPLIDTWPVFGVLLVRPGESSAMPASVRAMASDSTWSCVMFCPTIGVAIGAGVSATTVTASATPDGIIVTFCSIVRPRGSVKARSTVWKFDSSNVTVYCPGGSVRKTYDPSRSLTFERTPWSAGDAAVTTTPGTGRPCWSFTTPRMVPDCTPCARALTGRVTNSRNSHPVASRVMRFMDA